MQIHCLVTLKCHKMKDGFVTGETSSVMAALAMQPVLTEHSLVEIRTLQAMEETKNQTRGKSRSYALLLQQWEKLIMQDGLLFRNYQDVSGNTQWSQLVGGTKSSARGDDMEQQLVAIWGRRRHWAI